ncbi:MAG: hypothetical protein FWD57_15370, partial [Polyangiaceae bacterium]|nr:hypothetical protein [Polyangiaceae bacterium]
MAIACSGPEAGDGGISETPQLSETFSQPVTEPATEHIDTTTKDYQSSLVADVTPVVPRLVRVGPTTIVHDLPDDYVANPIAIPNSGDPEDLDNDTHSFVAHYKSGTNYVEVFEYDREELANLADVLVARG